MQVIKQHTTLADFVSTVSGTMNVWFATAMLAGVGITDDVAPGTALEVVAAEVVPVVVPLQVQPYVKPAQDYVLLRHQTIADFVTEHAGDINTWFSIALLNGIGITEPAQPGATYAATVSNKAVVAYFSNNGLHVSNDYRTLPPVAGGIGYMRIIDLTIDAGNEFIVS